MQKDEALQSQSYNDKQSLPEQSLGYTAQSPVFVRPLTTRIASPPRPPCRDAATRSACTRSDPGRGGGSAERCSNAAPAPAIKRWGSTMKLISSVHLPSYLPHASNTATPCFHASHSKIPDLPPKGGSPLGEEFGVLPGAMEAQNFESGRHLLPSPPSEFRLVFFVLTHFVICSAALRDLAHRSPITFR